MAAPKVPIGAGEIKIHATRGTYQRDRENRGAEALHIAQQIAGPGLALRGSAVPVRRFFPSSGRGVHLKFGKKLPFDGLAESPEYRCSPPERNPLGQYRVPYLPCKPPLRPMPVSKPIPSSPIPVPPQIP